MKKVYQILELTSTNLESRYVSEEFGYSQKKLYSYLFTEIDDTKMHYESRDKLNNYFKTLEEAENFIDKNIQDYEEWTIVCTYKK